MQISQYIIELETRLKVQLINYLLQYKNDWKVVVQIVNSIQVICTAVITNKEKVAYSKTCK